MRLVLVAAGSVPNPDSSGAALTNWTIVSYLLERGHEVAVVAVHPAAYADPAGASAEERLERLRALGAEVRPIVASSPESTRSLVRRAVRPADVELFPNLADADAVRAAVEELAPDAAFVYHWDGLAASRALRGVVARLGVCVDLAHLPPLYRFRHEPKPLSRETLVRLALLQSTLRRSRRLQVELLRECEASADFAAHHADWLRRHGVPNCRYLHTPVPDPGIGPATGPGSGRLLLIGHLRGTSTLDGLALFAREILPRVPADVEIRIAGGFEPPPSLARELDRPNVTFLGHLTQPADEFRSADALVVPTAVPLGARVRILSAFSFACPVVAHAANALGIPELADGKNALLARSGRELAEAISRIVASQELKLSLATAARETYERWFAPPVAAARIEQLLESIAGASARPGSRPAGGRPPIPARP